MASCHATHVAPPRALLTPPPRVARAFARPLKSARHLRCSPHCPGWTASATRLHRARRPSRAPHRGPRHRSSQAEDTDAGEGCGGGRGVGGGGRAAPGSPGSGSAAEAPAAVALASVRERSEERRGTGSRAENGRPRVPEDREDRSLRAARPTRGRGPHTHTVRRTAPGRTPHAWSRRRLPRLRGFTYTSLQLRTPWCCHRALRDPEALGGRLRHFTCVCTAVHWCLCKKKLDTHRPHGCMHPEGTLRGHRRWPSAHNESGLRRNQFC
ncbi:uncharacterized protein LOC132004975 [Mustela nigripes]|uniref:uncharacterized protein LOC132004975 n=1 Tax=Mustela nigripes TaxID=77151 RepID=UPI002814C129|nr:uncharacterized protein LOC132004975 [Mustela nigripes]